MENEDKGKEKLSLSRYSLEKVSHRKTASVWGLALEVEFTEKLEFWGEKKQSFVVYLNLSDLTWCPVLLFFYFFAIPENPT